MSATSKLPKDLQGKEIYNRTAELDIKIKFGAWKNYSSWVNLEKNPNEWHKTNELEQTKVQLDVTLDNTILYQQTFKKFEVINIHHVFSDEDHQARKLNFKITNLNNLQPYDDTNLFVSGMFKIEFIKLQGISMRRLIDDTFFSKDTDLSIEFSTPIYSWMVESWPKILPRTFNLPMTDIENYNRKNLFFR